jgi:hypothetical protein
LTLSFLQHKRANNPEISRRLCTDLIGGGNRVPLRFMHSLLAIRPAIEPDDFDLCPVLLAQPAADTWTTLEASKPFFDLIKGPKELVTRPSRRCPGRLENCGHSPGGAAQVPEFHRQLFASSSESLRQESTKITGMEVREAAAEIDPATGAVVQAFTTGNVVQVFQLAGIFPFSG